MDTPFGTNENDRYHSNPDSSLANDDAEEDILAGLNILEPLPPLLSTSMDGSSGSPLRGSLSKKACKREHREHKSTQRRTSQLMDEYQEYIASIEDSDGITSPPRSIHSRQHAVDGDDDDRHGNLHSKGMDPKKPFTDTNDLWVSWKNEMNFFEMTSGMNNGEINIHEQNDNVSDSEEGRHRRHSYARGLLCSFPTPICCSKRVARYFMVTCTVVGCLIAIKFGVTMERKNEPTNVGTFKDVGYVWFDRSSKWKGQTYAEAVDFCTSNNQMLCPYETICPFGPGGSAVGVTSGGFGDEKDDNSPDVAWVAINEAPNAWAHVGDEDHCLKYDFIHGEPPAWGITGEENEEITRHTVCCPPTSTSKNAKKNAPFEPDDTPPISLYQPLDNTWYTRSDGWQGSTFDEALKFCGTKGTEHFPCPYDAYCPKGPHFPPVEGGPTTQEGSSKDENETSSWSPIVDEIGDGIVQVAGGNDKICKVHHLSLEDDIAMLRGKGGLKDSMTHVMCCQLVDDNN